MTTNNNAPAADLPRRRSSFVLQNNADQSAAAVVDHTLNRFLQTGAGGLRHVQQLALQPFVDQLVQTFAKDVGLPDLQRVVLEIGQQAVYQFFGLPLGADNGIDLGVDGGLHQVNGRRAGTQPHPVFTALPDDLGFFQMQLVD